MEDITKKTYTLFIFVDEAGVLLGKYKKRAQGFYSVVSMVNKPITSKKISILTAIIPEFGPLYKWFHKRVKGKQYAKFIREVAYLAQKI